MTDDLKYSAYYWHLNQQTDSFEFYLVNYIDIDKNGHFNLMRHDDLKHSPEYFSGIINDTVWRCIDTTLAHNKFKTDYSYITNPNFVYDGFTYCLDYKTDNNNRKQILFVPNNSPDQIKILGDVLDTLVYNAKILMPDTLDLKEYTKNLKKLAEKIDPPPPPPSKAKVILFKPPKTK